MAQWTPEDVIRLSNERDVYVARMWQLAREEFERGLEQGREEGYAYALHEEAIERGIVGAPFRRPGPSWRELERRRWGRKGRAHFGDPRPGDFPGRAVS